MTCSFKRVMVYEEERGDDKPEIQILRRIWMDKQTCCSWECLVRTVEIQECISQNRLDLAAETNRTRSQGFTYQKVNTEKSVRLS